MRSKSEWPRMVGSALCAAFLLTAAGHVYSQEASPGKKAPAAAAESESQKQARAILMRMAEFLGHAPSFSVSVNGAYDSVQKSGQKIEWGENRKVTLSRPDRLRVEAERSDGGKTLAAFDGKQIVLIDTVNNVYATTPQEGGVDETIVHFVRDLGMRMPLAMLLVSGLPKEFENRVRSVDYVEKTNILGKPSHHLAARTDAVDFQVWVADGDQPLPLRIVLTYRKAAGQPQYWAQFSDWNLAPAINDTTFTLAAPAGAQKVAFAAELARASVSSRKQSANKGAK